MRPSRLRFRILADRAVAALVAAASPTAGAQTFPHGDGQGKLLLTGGVSSIDGAAGGGLTPWAVVGSYATEGEVGASAFVTRLRTRDYGLTAAGVALGLNDRVEFSLARQRFDAAAAVGAPAILDLDIAGAKWRVAGDAVLDSDRWSPQVAIGAEFKHLHPGGVGPVLDALGARRDGIDLYASATKLFLAQGVLVDGTLRATRANQNGLLGFGARGHGGYHLAPEVSVAWLPRRDLAIGAEVRAQPNHLAFAGEALRENAWRDLFVAWAPGKLASVTLAWVDLGNIVGKAHQSGAYLSLQLAH